MKKETTEEQVQDHLQDENGGGGGNYHSFEATKTDKAIVWVTLALIAFAIGLTIFLCVK
jgi:hypothetical protein